MTASAITSVSLDPPMLLFCVHTDARFRDALDDVDTWSVSVLADDQAHTADWLASPGGPRSTSSRASRTDRHPSPTRCGSTVPQPGSTAGPTPCTARGTTTSSSAPSWSPSRALPVRVVSSTCAGACTASAEARDRARPAPPVAASTLRIAGEKSVRRRGAAIQFARARRLARTRRACVEQRGSG